MPPTLKEDPDGTPRPAQAASIGEKKMNQNLACSRRGQKLTDVTMPRRRAVKPRAVVMLEILLATTLTLSTLTVIVRPKAADPATPAVAYPGSVVERSKWDMVAGEFFGAGATVRPYSADQPNMMVVKLLPGVVLSRSEAKRLASSAAAALGPFALVIIRDSSGTVIAKGYI